MNCHVDVPSGTAKAFKGVYVCSDCHKLAERALENLERELRSLLTLAGESIRIALIEGRLQFSQATPGEELSKKQILEAILSSPGVRRDPSPSSTDGSVRR